MKIKSNAQFPTRECPGCAMQVPSNENNCPICGYAFPARGSLQRNLIWIVLLLLALLIPLIFR